VSPNPIRKRRSARALPFLAALAFLLGLWACNVSDSGKTYMEIHIDSAWIGYDSIQVSLMDSTGKDLGIVFHGSVKAVTDLNRVLVEDYHGEKIQVVIVGFKGGKAVKHEYRLFDGATESTQLTDSVPIVAGGGNRLSLQRDNLLLFLGGAPEALKAYPLIDWQGKSLAWTSADESIVRVSQLGVVSPYGVGSAYVFVASGALKDSVLVQVVKDTPLLTVGSDTVVPPKSSVAFRVKVTQTYGYVKSFSWDLDGDGVYDDTQSGFPAAQTEFLTPPHKYDSAGSLILKFKIVDGEGNEGFATRKLLVSARAPRIDSLGGDVRISIKDTVDFAAGVSEFGDGALSGYAWDFDGDGVADDSAALSGIKASVKGKHVYPDSGIFHVTLWISDSAGTRISGNLTVTVKLDAPSADAGPDLVSPVGASVTLKGKGTDSLGKIVKREWQIGGAAFQETSDGDITFDAPSAAGAITCTFKVTDDDGLTALDAMTLTVGSASGPILSALVPLDTVITVKDSVPFAARADGPSAALKSYAWDFNGDSAVDGSGTLSGSGAAITGGYRYPAAGVYPVTLKVTDQNNKVAVIKTTVTVKQDKPAADAGPDFTVLPGETISLHGSAKDTLGIVKKLEWRIGAGVFTQVSKADTSFPAPSSPQSLNCVFRVTDDDDQTALDSLTVTVSAFTGADLKSLAVTSGSLVPAFTAGNIDYVDTVGNATASINITPAALDTGASIEVNTVAVKSGAAYNVGLPEGAETLVSVMVKARNNAGTKTYKIKVYRRALPGAPAVSGPASPTSNKTPAWTWSSAPGGTGDFRYKLDDTNMTVGATADRKTSYTPAALADGVHTLYVQEKDGAGQWSGRGSFSVTVDATPPVKPNVSVSPAGSTNNAKPTWTWTSGGGGTGDFRYWKDNESPSIATATRQTSYTPAASFAEGLHTVFVEEQDAAGNWSAMGSAQVTIDLTKPSAPGVTGPGSPTNSATPTWTWTPGGGGKGIFRFQLDNPTLAGTGSAATSYTPASPLTEATHILYVQESDDAGNWSDNGSFPVTVDVTKPNAPSVGSSPRSPFNGLKPTLTWSAGGGGGNGVFQVKFGSNDFSTGFTTVSQAPYTYTPASNLAEGDQTFWVRERDAAGNWSNASSRTLTLAPAGQVGGLNYLKGDYSSYVVVNPSNQVFHAGNANGPLVNVLQGSSFVTTGSVGSGNLIDMTLDRSSNQPWATFSDTGYKTCRVMAYNGSSWSKKGSTITGNQVHAYGNSAAAWVTYRDTSQFNGLVLDRLNGSSWTRVSSSSAGSNAVRIALVVNSSGKPIVAYSDEGGSTIVTQTLDGNNNWTSFGSAASLSTTASGISMAITSTDKIYLLITEQNNNYRILVSTSGGAWQPFATGPGNLSEAALAVDAAGNPYVAYINNPGYNLLYVQGYLGGSWQPVGSPYDAGAETMDAPSLSISPKGVPYAAFDIYSGNMNVARFSFDN
jgi:hypothetical protein